MNKFFGILTLAASFCAMSFAQEVETVSEVAETAAPVAEVAAPAEETVPADSIVAEVPAVDSAVAEAPAAAATDSAVAEASDSAVATAEPVAEQTSEQTAEQAAEQTAAEPVVAETPAPAEETPVAEPVAAESAQTAEPATVAAADSAKAPEKPKLIQSDEPTFAIEIQPISLSFYPMIRHGLTFYATIEVVINSNSSVITRPYYASKTISKNLQSGDVSIFGLSEGYRYYFARKHVGWFAAANVSFEYIKVEHKYNDADYDDIKDTGNNIGIALYLGRKFQVGKHFVTSLDAGLMYNQAFIDKNAKKDVNDVTNDGVGFDINYTLGFAF